MRSQRGARSHAPSSRNMANLLWRIGAPALAVSLWAGCDGGGGREIREWRPEDHQAPPAVAEEGRAKPQKLDQGDESRIASALWTTRCARCHGDTGRGDGSGAPPGAPLPDFADPEFHEQRSNEELALVVVKGRNLMPSFADELGPREIALLVAHVRSFGQPTEAEAKSEAEAPAPVAPVAPDEDAQTAQ